MHYICALFLFTSFCFGMDVVRKNEGPKEIIDEFTQLLCLSFFSDSVFISKDGYYCVFSNRNAYSVVSLKKLIQVCLSQKKKLVSINLEFCSRLVGIIETGFDCYSLFKKKYNLCEEEKDFDKQYGNYKVVVCHAGEDKVLGSHIRIENMNDDKPVFKRNRGYSEQILSCALTKDFERFFLTSVVWNGIYTCFYIEAYKTSRAFIRENMHAKRVLDFKTRLHTRNRFVDLICNTQR